ncbi:MFS transporter [Enterobacter asburiae]|nr:MFS transporter [Enterobacter asburiae]
MQNHLTTSQRRALWALSLAYFIQATGSLSVAGSLGSISQEWGISDAQSARLLSIFGLTFALGAPLAQVLFGKLMRRTQVLAGMLVFGLGAFIFAIAPDYKLLVASRIVMGLGASLIGPVLVALGAELVAPKERGSAIATILLGVSMASMVGIPLATWVASAWGARLLFMLVTLVSLVTAAGVWILVFSHEDGTRLGVEHLIALGHQQIALLAGPLSSVSARLRLADWHKYLTRNQIHPIAEREGDWSAMSGFQQTMQMLNEGIVPTAMLVANDQMALGAMRAITESGLRVGADISVVGYDDTEDSSCYIPPLTTIKQDFRLLGKTSVDRLLKLSQGQAVKSNQLLPVSLVKRKTTLPPNTQTTSPRTLADSLMQLARQVSRLESGQ